MLFTGAVTWPFTVTAHLPKWLQRARSESIGSDPQLGENVRLVPCSVILCGGYSRELWLPLCILTRAVLVHLPSHTSINNILVPLFFCLFFFFFNFFFQLSLEVRCWGPIPPPLPLFLYLKIFIYLAVLSLSFGMWDLWSSLQHAGS